MVRQPPDFDSSFLFSYQLPTEKHFERVVTELQRCVVFTGGT